MTILNPIEGKLIEYTPRVYQNQLIDALVSNKNVIVQSARQMGVTTTLLFAVQSQCISKPNYKALIVYPNGLNARDKCDTFAKFNYEYIIRKTKNTIHYANGSVIEFIAIDKPIIGKSYNGFDIYFENYEHMNPNGLNTLAPALTKSKIRFYSFSGNTDFTKENFETIKWNYTLNDDFNSDKWVDIQIQCVGKEMFERECVVG